MPDIILHHYPLSTYSEKVRLAFGLKGLTYHEVITPIAMRILRQDASILRLQAKAIQRFGGEDFTSTEIDVLGPHIWKLLAAASSGDTPAPFDHRVTMRV